MRLPALILTLIPSITSLALPPIFTHLHSTPELTINPFNDQTSPNDISPSTTTTNDSSTPLSLSFSIYNFTAQINLNAFTTSTPSWATFSIQDAASAAKYECSTTTPLNAPWAPCKAYTNNTSTGKFSFSTGKRLEWIAVRKEWVVAGLQFSGSAVRKTEWEEGRNATRTEGVDVMRRAKAWGFEMRSVWMKVR